MVTETIDYTTLVSSYLGISSIWALVLLTIIGIWTLIWKGLALWKSAQKKQSIWFIALLVINTMGLFEILYIFIFSKIKIERKENKKKKLTHKKK